MVPDLSNVMGQKIFVYKDPDLLPALAIASGGVCGGGRDPGRYEVFIRDTGEPGTTVIRGAGSGRSRRNTNGIYQKYKNIYPW